MEIKIIISDTGSGTASIKTGAEPSTSSTNVSSPAASGQQVSAPPEVLRAAAAVGAIDGGPAPTLGGSMQFGAPPPFSSGTGTSGTSDVGSVTGSPGTSAGESTAAAPASEYATEEVTPVSEN